MKFVCDEMLGTLAKWLRILGYDTAYVKNMEDDEILKIAEKEDRIIITRDKVLAEKSEKALYIDEKDLEKQIEKVFKKLNLEIDEDKILSRCTLCNTPVTPIKKEKIEGKVPEHVWKTHEKFWICPKCKRIYWMGSHWNDMEEKIKKIKDYQSLPL